MHLAPYILIAVGRQLDRGKLKLGPRFREDDTIKFCLTRGAHGRASGEVVVDVREFLRCP